jgi:hypothetical protein
MSILEVTKTGSTDEANRLLAEGWTLFTVVSGGGEHVHYILTKQGVGDVRVPR